MDTKIRQFLEENFLVDFDETPVEQDLFQTGYIDSFGFIELVGFLESEFDISIPNEDLVSGALASLTSILQYVKSKQDD